MCFPLTSTSFCSHLNNVIRTHEFITAAEFRGKQSKMLVSTLVCLQIFANMHFIVDETMIASFRKHSIQIPTIFFLFFLCFEMNCVDVDEILAVQFVDKSNIMLTENI